MFRCDWKVFDMRAIVFAGVQAVPHTSAWCECIRTSVARSRNWGWHDASCLLRPTFAVQRRHKSLPN